MFQTHLIQILSLLFFTFGCASLHNRPEGKLDSIVFEVTEGILHPESAIYSKSHDFIFVSNMPNGNPFETEPIGYISKLSKTGEVLESKWATGLRAPKGMGIYQDRLYVSDIDRVVEIDILTGKILREFFVKRAKFLNDVAVDRRGFVYISDMFDDAIYVIKKNHIGLWRKDKKLAAPNGLFFDEDNQMVIAQWGKNVDEKTFKAQNPGHLAYIKMDASKKSFKEQDTISGHLDGIDADTKNNLWASDWISGDVYRVTPDGIVELKYNFGPGTADISVMSDKGILLVPQMNQNKVLGVLLKD